MTQIKNNRKIDAVLWDFDGTLADSAAKNIAISKQILSRVAPRLTGKNLPDCLRSASAYHVANHGATHWRELYRDYFGMSEDEIKTAGPLWNTYQALDKTPVTLFEGIHDAVTSISHFPQGICSANSTDNITEVLEQNGISAAFQSVIGYENLQLHEQKPAALGGVKCLQQIFGDPTNKNVVFIGDHIADVLFARDLGRRLGPTCTVTSVSVTYSGAQPENWPHQPDIVVESPAELISFIKDQDRGNRP